MTRPLILITNDDGIASPGLAAVAAALDPLGELLIVAPASQQTSMGRSRSQQGNRDGRLRKRQVHYGNQSWDGVAANATPALAVEHGIQELAMRPVALVVSGINYGENVGTCVTVSGTIGAAMEAAERGIPAMAVSLETRVSQYHEYDETIDFGTAIHFVRFFAARILGKTLPPDVDVLKIDIPASATPETGWIVTRQDKMSYYTPAMPKRSQLFGTKGRITHAVAKGEFSQEGSDTHALAKGIVSLTPLSLDLTSRVSLNKVRGLFD